MYDTSGDIKAVLWDCGVRNLYHANTVATALSFLRAGGLLSRGYAEDLGVQQTPQQSDESDREFGVYYDIFFDATDIHAEVRNLNFYGPVTFVYSLDVLDIPGLRVQVTRANPQYWGADWTEEARYFTTLRALQAGYHHRDFGQHITLRDLRAPLPFSPYLREILLEDPQIPETRYFTQAVAALSGELVRQRITAPLVIRECPRACGCRDSYRERREGFTYYRFRTEC